MHAAIDVGSNTVRLLIANLENGNLHPLQYHRAITRLGGRFTADRGLDPEAMARTLTALQAFRRILAPFKLTSLRLAGTEIVRRAANQAAFLTLVRRKTGWEPEVLSGVDEARLSTVGVLAVLDPQPDQALIFDLGGGSLELTLLRRNAIVWQHSHPLGVVGVCEGFASDELRARAIREQLEQIMSGLADAGLFELATESATLLVGTAGTVTTLAAVQQQMELYRCELINNTCLTRQQICNLRQSLAAMNQAQRHKVIGLEAGREDLIVPGADIVLALMQMLHKPVLTVCDWGLLEGLIIDQIEPGFVDSKPGNLL